MSGIDGGKLKSSVAIQRAMGRALRAYLNGDRIIALAELETAAEIILADASTDDDKTADVTGIPQKKSYGGGGFGGGCTVPVAASGGALSLRQHGMR